MKPVVWTIGVVVVADLTVVAWLVLVDVLDRRRKRRELEQLEALWRGPAARHRRPVHATAGARGSGGDIAAPTTLAVGPVLAERPRARKVSLAALVGALTVLSTVMAVDGGGGSLDRASTAGGGVAVSGASRSEGDRGFDRRGQLGGSPMSDGEAVPDAPPTVAGVLFHEPSPSSTQAPERIAAAPRSSDEIVLAWADVDGAVGYAIARSEAPIENASWTVIARTDADDTTYVDTGLDAGTTYFYRVSSITEDGPAPSDVVSATTLPEPPSAPTLNGSADGDGITLEWSDIDGETGYRVERADDGSDTWMTIATVGKDVTTYVDGGLTKDAVYSYRVVATSGSGDSEPSNVVTLTVGGAGGVSGGDGSQASEPSSPEPSSPEPSSEEPATTEPTTQEPTTQEPTTSGSTSPDPAAQEVAADEASSAGDVLAG